MKMIKLRPLIFAAFLALPFASSHAQVGISVNLAPPVLPVYEQPPCPVEGYIWTPGYWAYETDYYWVPGVWVAPPTVGLLWTPPWWGWNNGVYVFNQGYWGPTVGFYGGINYGHGYWGDGYWGGHWQGNTFAYNTAVTRVNNNFIHNTYVDRNVMNKEVNRNRAAFNGPNGVKAEANAEQKAAAANAKKMPPTSQQLKRQEAASKDKNLQAKVNKGHPNNEAIKSFDKTEGQGPGGEGRGLAGEKGEHKAGNMAEQHGQGGGMNAEEHGKKQGAENRGNRHEGENLQGNKQKLGGDQAKMHTGKGAKQGGPAHGQHAMNKQMSRNAQMGGPHPQKKSGHPQMGGKHLQAGGGNRPKPGGQQQQGKKKQGKPEQHGHR
jgi:WXXGXW repeat (2 copies)